MIDLYKPDIIHIHLVYFTITPQIIVEAHKRGIPVIQTVHDSKIVCCNHRLFIPHKTEPCLKCLNNGFGECVTNKCIKNSLFLSFLAKKESEHYKKRGVYNLISKFIFPSEFMQNIHVESGIDKSRTIVLNNFSRIQKASFVDKTKFDNKYVLYFGRVSVEKGMHTLKKIVESMPTIRFVIVGTGNLLEVFKHYENCELVGFKEKDELIEYVKNATISLFPSVWYENCPMSILESIALGTPVVGSKIGGIPELIEEGTTGFVVEPSNYNGFVEKINDIFWNDKLLIEMSNNCLKRSRITDVKEYVDKLENIYKEFLR